MDSDEEGGYTIFRTDGYWYNDAYNVLQKFACMLKGQELARLSMPDELCQVIGKYTSDNDVYGLQRLTIAKQASDYILTTLQERMAALSARHPECVYSAADPYMNVINYFRTLKGDYFLKDAEDKYLLENVLPWLGLTDWGSNSGSKGGKYGGRTRQMQTFKYKLEQLLKQMRPPSKKRSAEDSVAVPASAEPEEARKKYFGSRGGKRLQTRKLRRKRKSSKRSCKRR